MKIFVLDGTFGNHYESLLNEIIDIYSKDEVEVFKIEDKKIAFCTGCWSCWLKTPGLCTHLDDTQEMLKRVINTDLVIHFTENSVGYVTSHTKKTLDKFIPLIHPYIILVNGECHHLSRYDKYPKLGLVYVDDTLNKSDFEITKHLFDRAALNFKTELALAIHTNSNIGVIKNEDFSI